MICAVRGWSGKSKRVKMILIVTLPFFELQRAQTIQNDEKDLNFLNLIILDEHVAVFQQYFPLFSLSSFIYWCENDGLTTAGNAFG